MFNRQEKINNIQINLQFWTFFFKIQKENKIICSHFEKTKYVEGPGLVWKILQYIKPFCVI